jgi:hypothetical protein
MASATPSFSTALTTETHSFFNQSSRLISPNSTTCHEMSKQFDTWQPDCRPEIYAESDHRLLSYISDQETIRESMQEAKTIAEASYGQVLEDGPDELMAEGDKEEYGKELTGMYASELIGPDGKPLLSLARITTEQANALRAARSQAAEQTHSVPTSRPASEPAKPVAKRKGRRPRRASGKG